MARYNIEIRIRSTGAKQAEAEITGLGGAFKRASTLITAAHAALIALPIGAVVRQVAQAVKEFDNINDSLTAATGSSNAAAREMQFVTKEAKRLGLDLVSTADAYGKYLAAARIAGATNNLARQGFVGLSEAAAGLGLSQEALATGLQNTTKMMAENKVSVRQLTGLFGSEFKGSLSIAAKSLGITTEELQGFIKEGKISADDLLPRMFEWMHKTFGPEAAENAKQLEGQLNNLNTEWKLFLTQGDTGREMADSVGAIAKSLAWVREHIGFVTGAWALMKQVAVEVLRAIAVGVFAVIKAFAALNETIGKFSTLIGRENRFAGLTDEVKQAEYETLRLLDALSEVYNDEAAAAFAGAMQKSVDPVKEVADHLNRGAAGADALADAAKKARAELELAAQAFTTAQLETPDMLFDFTDTSGELHPVWGQMWDDLEDRAQEFYANTLDEGEKFWEDLAEGGEFVWPDYGDAGRKEFKQLGADIKVIFADAFASVVSGAATTAEAIRSVFAGVFAAAGVAIGTALGGPVGGQIGGALGGAFGSLIGPQSHHPFGGGDFSISNGQLGFTAGSKNWKVGTDEIARIGRQMADQVNAIFESFGGVLESLSKDIGFIIDNGRNIVNINGVQRNFGENFQAALEFFILETIKAAEVSGLSADILAAIKLAAEQAGENFGAFQKDLAFIQAFDDFGKDSKTIALENLERWFADASETAARLGLDLTKVNAEYERQREEILGLAAAEKQRLEEEKRLQEERQRAHEAAVEARRAFRDELELLELTAGGASDGLVDLVRRVQELDSYLEEQRAAGVRGTGRFRDLTLQGLLDDILAPVREVLAPTSEMDQVIRHYQDVREQVRFIAEAMGIAIEPLLALIDAAEQAELQRFLSVAIDAPPDTAIRIDAFAEKTKAATDAVEQLGEAAQSAADAAREYADQIADLVGNFQSKFDAFIGRGDSPEEIKARILADAQAVKSAFGGLPFDIQKQAIEALGGTWPGGAGANAEFFRLIDDKAAQKIADAIAEALSPITDYFDDLRTSGAGLTTRERYENVLAEFNAAIAAGDINRSVELARMLTGDVGVAQFGSSSQAFKGLQDMIVTALGGFLPDGPPADLLNRQVAAMERSATSLDAIMLSNDRINSTLIAGFDRLERAARQRVEAGHIN